MFLGTCTSTYTYEYSNWMSYLLTICIIKNAHHFKSPRQKSVSLVKKLYQREDCFLHIFLHNAYSHMVLPLSAIFFFGYLFGHFAEIDEKIMYIRILKRVMVVQRLPIFDFELRF